MRETDVSIMIYYWKTCDNI